MTAETRPVRPGAALVVLALVLGLIVVGRAARQGVQPWLYFGGPLIELAAPLSGSRVPIGSVQLQVKFPKRGRVASDTFRCLLNGADVTSRLTVAENGADGALFPLREGRNTLRVEIFGKVLWDDRLMEDSVEIEFVTRPLPPWDRALAAPPRGAATPAAVA